MKGLTFQCRSSQSANDPIKSHRNRTRTEISSLPFTQRFMILSYARFSWDGALAEDMWFCYKSIDIYHELSDEFKPADVIDEMSFSSETIPSERPFGLHKFWPWLQPDTPEVRRSLENCPEALGIFPPELLDSHSGWHDLICSLDVAWESFDSRTNITFDYRSRCGPNLSTQTNLVQGLRI